MKKIKREICYRIIKSKRMILLFLAGILLTYFYTDVTLWQILIESDLSNLEATLERIIIYMLILFALYFNLYLVLGELLRECRSDFYVAEICGKEKRELFYLSYQALLIDSLPFLLLSAMIFMGLLGMHDVLLGLLCVLAAGLWMMIFLYRSCKRCFR